MKVTGPQPGAPVPESEGARGKSPAGEIKPGAGAAAESESIHGKPAGPTFAETLAAGRAAPASTATRVKAPDALTADIAADLRAGKVDAQGALERVVERVLDRQLGKDAPADLRAQLRDALRDTISSDPLLAERIRGLGQ
jgi:hypothetical protein